MFTLFEKPIDSKELFFALSNSFQIVTPESKSQTHKFAGLYAIFKGDTCYYVGQSQNLPSRISQHLSGKYSTCDRVEVYYPVGDGFDDFYDRNKESRKSILELNELVLMKMLSPVENLITPDSDFNPEENRIFLSFRNYDYLEPSICINISKHQMCVSVSREPEFIYDDLMHWHNKEVLNLVETAGLEIAMENVCRG